MNEAKEKAPVGKRFTALIEKSRWKDQQVEFVRALGVTDNPGQKLTHWKNRGIPGRLANAAADLLGCEPHEISAVKPATPRKSGTSKLPDGAATVLKIAEAFSADQWAALAEAAVWIKSGRTIAAREPPPPHVLSSGTVK